MAEELKKKGAMSVSEAGRKGGQTVRDKYGHAFYEEIGRKGGEGASALATSAASSSTRPSAAKAGSWEAARAARPCATSTAPPSTRRSAARAARRSGN